MLVTRRALAVVTALLALSMLGCSDIPTRLIRSLQTSGSPNPVDTPPPIAQPVATAAPGAAAATVTRPSALPPSPTPVPTPTQRTSSAPTPARASTIRANHCVAESAAEMPTRRPRSCRASRNSGKAGPPTHHHLRRAPQQREGSAVDAALAQDHRVLESAGHQVGVAADHGLLGQAAAGMVLQIDAQALVVEIMELPGQDERQVVQRGQAAHRQGHAWALQPRLRAQRGAGQQPERGRRGQPAAALEIGRRASGEHGTRRSAKSTRSAQTVYKPWHACIGTCPDGVFINAIGRQTS